MKRKAIVSFVVIIGLFLTSILTLMAMYSASQETILLFEENFENLDEKKWERHTRDCSGKGGQSGVNYGSNSYVDDGVLLFEPLFVEGSDSEAEKYIEKCNLCAHENGTDADCVQGLSTTFKTRNSFQAKHGKVELRLKLPSDNSLKTSIGIILSNSTSEDAKSLEGFKIIETVGNENKNGSGAELKLFFGPHGNETSEERTVTKADFHVYEIEWENDCVEFKIDGVKAKKFELRNSTLKEDKFFGQPFNLYFDIRLQEKNIKFDSEESLNLFKNSTSDESIMTDSSNSSTSGNNSSLVVDYVKLFKKPD